MAAFTLLHECFFESHLHDRGDRDGHDRSDDAENCGVRISLHTGQDHLLAALVVAQAKKDRLPEFLVGGPFLKCDLRHQARR